MRAASAAYAFGQRGSYGARVTGPSSRGAAVTYAASISRSVMGVRSSGRAEGGWSGMGAPGGRDGRPPWILPLRRARPPPVADFASS